MSDQTQASAQTLNCAGRLIDLSVPHVMGVLNVTPDSFSDGGQYNASLDDALRRAETMVAEGASFIDVGGESTRPGADPMSVADEIDRVLPIVEAVLARVVPVVDALAREFDVVVSVDSSKPRVMLESVGAGAGLLNDVRALQEPGALSAVARLAVPVCLMHMQGQPSTMQKAPQYRSVLEEVLAFLHSRIEACETAGIARSRIIVDPGFGFGKSPEHNLTLLNCLNELQQLGLPILAGLSRKSLLGQITGRPVAERLIASVAAATLAVYRGARIIRAHDVAATMDAVKVAHATIRETLDE